MWEGQCFTSFTPNDPKHKSDILSVVSKYGKENFVFQNLNSFSSFCKVWDEILCSPKSQNFSKSRCLAVVQNLLTSYLPKSPKSEFLAAVAKCGKDGRNPLNKIISLPPLSATSRFFCKIWKFQKFLIMMFVWLLLFIPNIKWAQCIFCEKTSSKTASWQADQLYTSSQACKYKI